MMNRLPVILHIPHSSTAIPDNVRASLLLSGIQLERELLRMTDAYTDDLFACSSVEGIHPVIYSVSRIVADPERFADDTQEPMAKHGMGAVYLRTLDGIPLRRPLLPGEREELLGRFYHPHHERLLEEVKDKLKQTDGCLIVDCHSFPEQPFLFEEHKDKVRPDICIGTDDFHTPSAIRDSLLRLFQRDGYSVAVNHPFSGCIVPLPFYGKNRNVYSVMIELNRKLYMDEPTGKTISGYPVLKKQLADIVFALSRGLY
jgi:N-formylglutamate amidohydrolase